MKINDLANSPVEKRNIPNRFLETMDHFRETGDKFDEPADKATALLEEITTMARKG